LIESASPGMHTLTDHRLFEKVLREPEIDPAGIVLFFQMIRAELQSGAFNICVQLIESPRPNYWDYRTPLIC
jgi:hypothetical protein